MGMALVIALALSLDGFGVGMAYGLKRIRIPLSSLVIIGSCTALAMGISMLFGNLITPYFKVIQPGVLGAVVLIAIGIYQLVQAVRSSEALMKSAPAMSAGVYAVENIPLQAETNEESKACNPYKTIVSIHFFGLIIQVLQTPDAADIDGSGIITINESILLGVALALDAFVSGMAASMAGISLYAIAFVALLQVMMIFTGQILTGKLPANLLSKAKYLPGFVLILIGTLKLF
ncbi:manganese efflux pump [Dehalobacter sp. DCM]|uniref:manganese efflux pump n=1 Tax=Dehalobacter sp. DCM TaxID=2907827 RepID=UPI003081907E|nr:manganese efflux pump [Dehalobacter sp. DCM]